MFYLPLIISVVLVCVTYLTGRLSLNCVYNHNLPKKYLIKSERIKKYFLNPSCEQSKDFVGLHFVMIFGLCFNLILYFRYWYNGSTQFILGTDLYMKIYGIVLMIIIMITVLINISLHAKYSFRK